MNISDLKILVSDDSILARKKTVECLHELGCGEVLEAANGQEAVDTYKKHKLDVVFMDIVMPVKTGLQALVEILEIEPSAKVVIASSSGTQSHLKTAIEAGAMDFLQKPIDQKQVKKILDRIAKGDD